MFSQRILGATQGVTFHVQYLHELIIHWSTTRIHIVVFEWKKEINEQVDQQLLKCTWIIFVFHGWTSRERSRRRFLQINVWRAVETLYIWVVSAHKIWGDSQDLLSAMVLIGLTLLSSYVETGQYYPIWLFDTVFESITSNVLCLRLLGGNRQVLPRWVLIGFWKIAENDLSDPCVAGELHSNG